MEPERLLAGEYPGAGDEARAVERLKQIREAGIDFFLDLTHDDDGLPPYEAAIAPLEHRRIPVRDFSCPSRDEMRAILDAIDDALAREKSVYVHCWGGIGRTGTAIGCWLVRHGRSAEEALALIARRRAETPDAARSSPETDEQRKLVEEWQPGD